MRKSVTKAKDVTCFPFSFLTDFLLTSVIQSLKSFQKITTTIWTQLITFTVLSHYSLYVQKTWLLLQKGNKTKYYC